jgi:hypothetical protein
MALGNHVYYYHNITARQFRIDNGMRMNKSLESPALRNYRSKLGKSLIRLKLLAQAREKINPDNKRHKIYVSPIDHQLRVERGKKLVKFLHLKKYEYKKKSGYKRKSSSQETRKKISDSLKKYFEIRRIKCVRPAKSVMAPAIQTN